MQSSTVALLPTPAHTVSAVTWCQQQGTTPSYCSLCPSNSVLSKEMDLDQSWQLGTWKTWVVLFGFTFHWEDGLHILKDYHDTKRVWKRFGRPYVTYVCSCAEDAVLRCLLCFEVSRFNLKTFFKCSCDFHVFCYISLSRHSCICLYIHIYHM